MNLPSEPYSKRRFVPSERILLVLTWACLIAMFCFYGFGLIRIGTDLRDEFWDHWQNNHFYGDAASALRHGQHILREAQALELVDLQTPANGVTAADAQSGAATPANENTLPTIAQPGPGLFDSPWDLPTVWHRWQRLRPVYGHLFHGWIVTYDNLVRDQPAGDYQMDYPPLRSLVMTLWAWKVQSDFPSIEGFPEKPTWLSRFFVNGRRGPTPDIVRPLLLCNCIAEGISAIAMFFLVWIWTGRGDPSPSLADSWRSRWGDPLLLIPPILLGIFTLLRPYIDFDFTSAVANPTLIDARITSIGWWIFLVLRYTSVVALARLLPMPFRAVACGVVAATMVWINPAAILDSVGWPQWEVWILPFFLGAAVLVSLDWWLTAGLLLAVGGMFKGQLFFIAPLLVLCPLFAGWIGRLMRITAGLAAGAGVIVWPWLITNSRAQAYVVSIMIAGAIVCCLSSFRLPIWRELRRLAERAHGRIRSRWSSDPVDSAVVETQPPPEISLMIWSAIVLGMVIAGCLSILLYKHQDPDYRKYALCLTLAILTVPWFIARRLIAGWLTLLFAAALWLAGFSLDGSFSWWQVGFVYGTQKHQDMQLGEESLSNLSSILERRYGWNLHDSVGTLHLPFTATPIDFDVQSALAALFVITLLLCTAAASVHLRRRDPKFLMTLVTPWVLFVGLLTQMAARYTIFPAMVASALVGLSLSASLLQLLWVVLSCTMLGIQMLRFDPSTSPMLFSIASRTFPDIGWLTILLAGLFLVFAMTPSRRPRNESKSGLTRLSFSPPPNALPQINIDPHPTPEATEG